MSKVSEQYYDFVVLFNERMMTAIADRNPNSIYEMLDAYANREGNLSNTEMALIGFWRSLFNRDIESFLWLGYVLSIKKGYENVLAYFFISSQQLPVETKQ
jgi:hypothetical protein